MFKGNVKMIIERLDSHDEYGEPLLSFIANVLCLVVRLQTSTLETPIRDTVSASHSNANEYVGDSILLVPPNSKIKIGDKLTVSGLTLRLSKIEPKYDTRGRHDHYQVGCSTWA